jgi:hypothetical protein
MSLRPNNLPPVQDMPPPGGYPEVSVLLSVDRRVSAFFIGHNLIIVILIFHSRFILLLV